MVNDGWLSTADHACVKKAKRQLASRKPPLSELSYNISLTPVDVTKMKQTSMLQFYTPQAKRRKKKKTDAADYSRIDHSLLSSRCENVPPTPKRSSDFFDKENCRRTSYVVPHKAPPLILQPKVILSQDKYQNNTPLPVSKERLERRTKLGGDKNPIKHSMFPIDKSSLNIVGENSRKTDFIGKSMVENTMELNFTDFNNSESLEVDNFQLSQPVLMQSRTECKTGSRSLLECSNHLYSSNEALGHSPSPLEFQMKNFDDIASRDLDKHFADQNSPLVFTEPFTQCRQEDFYENSQAVLF